MLRFAIVIGCVVVLGVGGCAPTVERIRPPGALPQSAVPPPPPGLKACLIVADFTDATSNAGQYRAELGRGLSRMLRTHLVQTGHFQVLAREQWKALRLEQHRRSLADRHPCLTTALLVDAAITAWDPGVAGGACSQSGSRHAPRFGRGRAQDILAPAVDLLGQLGCAWQKASLAADIEVIDSHTEEIVTATAVRGDGTSFRLGAGFESQSLGHGLEIFAKTPMEKVLRGMIGEMTAFLTEEIPRHYFQPPTRR